MQMKQFKVFEEQGRPDLKDMWRLHYLEDDKPTRRMTESKSIREMQGVGFEWVHQVYRAHMEAIITALKTYRAKKEEFYFY